jgi:hypothetical protein
MNGKWLLMELKKSFCCATGASQKGRFGAFAKPSANVSYLRILLKKSETKAPRKSRSREHIGVYTGSRHSKA